MLDAAAELTPPARVLFVSTFDLFGRTQDKPPPRRVSDPIVATDSYTSHKLQCEELVQSSGLDWSIVRLADLPIIGFRSPSPIMFELPLANRFEVVHSKDAGLALARAVNCDQVWGRVVLVGGGPSCQVTYREYLEGMLNAMGLGTLPDQAFTSRAWPCDWIDSTDAQQLLDYQHHSFADIMEEVRYRTRVARPWIRAVSPIARWYILRGSPYLREGRSDTIRERARARWLLSPRPQGVCRFATAWIRSASSARSSYRGSGASVQARQRRCGSPGDAGVPVAHGCVVGSTQEIPGPFEISWVAAGREHAAPLQ